jgi:N-acetylglucosamine-6-phosphate deacetylase
MDPELPGANDVAALLCNEGITVALGHSNGTYESASNALQGNYSHVTHTFNAQSGFGHRAPGVFGAVLTSDNVTTELIADKVHVHPGAMKVLVRCVGTDRIVLVTDAMAGAGLGDGTFEIVGQTVFLKGDIATLENGTLAGSIATLDQCVHHMVEDVGVTLYEAVKMASLNPSKAIGLDNRLGSIQVGKDASLIVIDEEVNVYITVVQGKIVYNSLN